MKQAVMHRPQSVGKKTHWQTGGNNMPFLPENFLHTIDSSTFKDPFVFVFIFTNFQVLEIVYTAKTS